MSPDFTHGPERSWDEMRAGWIEQRDVGAVVALLALGVAVFGTGCAGSSGVAARPTPQAPKTSASLPPSPSPIPGQFQDGCDKPDPSIRSITFSASDGQMLVGALFGTGHVGVILAHQSDGGACRWVPFARILAQHGYMALPFYFRGYGPSIAPVKEHTDLDLVGAAAELRRQGATRVVLIGASLGGAAVLVAGKQIPSASVIISVSAPAVFGDLDAATAAQTLDVPVLFLASKQDQPFGGDAQTLFAERHRPGDRIVLYPGYLHGIDLVEGPMGAQVRALMLSFIRSHTGS